MLQPRTRRPLGSTTASSSGPGPASETSNRTEARAGFGDGGASASPAGGGVTPATWEVAASNVIPWGGSVQKMGGCVWSPVSVEKTRSPGELKLELHTQTSLPSGVTSASAREK